jgi:hypothetical protein
MIYDKTTAIPKLRLFEETLTPQKIVPSVLLEAPQLLALTLQDRQRKRAKPTL